MAEKHLIDPSITLAAAVLCYLFGLYCSVPIGKLIFGALPQKALPQSAQEGIDIPLMFLF